MKAVVGFEAASDFDPDVHFKPTLSPDNFILKYFWTVFWTLLISFVIWGVRKLFSLCFVPYKYVDFVDLCTVSNQSMFIFDQRYHGYYIHGVFPGENSDVTLEQLKLSLDDETNDTRAYRGLINIAAGDQDLTTFEVFVSAKDRTYFNVIFNDESREFHMNKNKKPQEQEQ